jgi:hypothetical protein
MFALFVCIAGLRLKTGLRKSNTGGEFGQLYSMHGGK